MSETQINVRNFDSDNRAPIDPLEFAGYLYKNIKYLVLFLLVGGIIGFLISSFVIKPRYSSFVDLYVKNTTKTETDAVQYTDINASQKLVSTYMVILQSNVVTKKVRNQLGNQMTDAQLLKLVTFSSVNETEVLRIKAETTDPKLTVNICKAYKEIASEALDDIVGAGSVRVISEPIYPKGQSYPNVLNFSIYGAFVGLFIGIILFLILMIFNNTVEDDGKLSERYDIPVLGGIPDFFEFYKELGISAKKVRLNKKLKGKNKENKKVIVRATLLSEKTPFQIKEAYNGIRSNILLSLSNMDNGIIMVSSPNANELKTTNSINIATALSQIGAKVLLVDADLRNPSVYRYFKIPNNHGLSKILMGVESFEEDVVRDVVPGMDILVAGPATPKPSELIGSGYMKLFLQYCALGYDFVVVDTSPVNLVSDSLAIVSVAGGVLMLAREGLTNYRDLDNAISLVENANGNIIGLIKTDIKSRKVGYYKKGYGYGYRKSKAVGDDADDHDDNDENDENDNQ